MVDIKKFEKLESLIEDIQKSRGQQILNEVERVQRSFRVVGRNRDDLVSALAALENEKTIPTLWNVDNRELLHERASSTGLMESLPAHSPTGADQGQ